MNFFLSAVCERTKYKMAVMPSHAARNKKIPKK